MARMRNEDAVAVPSTDRDEHESTGQRVKEWAKSLEDMIKQEETQKDTAKESNTGEWTAG